MSVDKYENIEQKSVKKQSKAEKTAKKDNSNKVKLLLLWEMLNSDSDAENSLSTSEILSRLADSGIACDRRTLYNDIKTLNEYGFEVLCELKNHSNHYYVAERGFDVPELKVLMDATTAANFISERKTKELHNKIAFLAGSNRAELLKKSQAGINLTKSQNEGVYYAVNELDEAILQGKKVSFQYFDLDVKGERVCRHNGQRYLVNPVATVFSSDHYYLMGFTDEREALSPYRIDKMQHVSIEDQPIDDPIWFRRINLAEHKRQLFSMYGGESTNATFEVDNSLIDVIFDKFGSKTHLKDLKNGKFSFSATIQASPTFFGWVFSFGSKLKIISPAKLIEQTKDFLQTILTQY